MQAAVQQTTHQLKNKLWRNKAREIQELAETNDISFIYNSTKAIFGSQEHGAPPSRVKTG